LRSNNELQELCLSTILKDVYLFNNFKNYITEEFFSVDQYKIIYRALLYFYRKYQNMPQEKELVSVIYDICDPSVERVNIDSIKSCIDDLYNAPDYEEAYVMEKIETFIKTNNIYSTLKTYLPSVKNSEDHVIEELGNKLVEGLSVDFRKVDLFTLGDVSKLAGVRSEAIGSDDQSLVIKSAIDPINYNLLFKGFKPGDLVMMVAAPGVGKTTYMINEGFYASLQGFKVLHVFIGDMTNYDGFVKYASRISGITQNEIVEMNVAEQAELVRTHNYNGIFNRIDMLSYPASYLTVDNLLQEVSRASRYIGKKYNMIVVDYADNLVEEDIMMYKSGGDIYNMLSYMARSNQSVVIVGSQPKLTYWREEIIPKEGASESSKKQHVVDIMLTFGKPRQDAKYGTMNIAKVRRGNDGKLVRLGTDMGKVQMYSISEQDYLKLKSADE